MIFNRVNQKARYYRISIELITQDDHYSYQPFAAQEKINEKGFYLKESLLNTVEFNHFFKNIYQKAQSILYGKIDFFKNDEKEEEEEEEEEWEYNLDSDVSNSNWKNIQEEAPPINTQVLMYYKGTLRIGMIDEYKCVFFNGTGSVAMSVYPLFWAYPPALPSYPYPTLTFENE